MMPVMSQIAFIASVQATLDASSKPGPYQGWIYEQNRRKDYDPTQTLYRCLFIVLTLRLLKTTPA
jgi:hypothetical protein